MEIASKCKYSTRKKFVNTLLPWNESFSFVSFSFSEKLYANFFVFVLFFSLIFVFYLSFFSSFQVLGTGPLAKGAGCRQEALATCTSRGIVGH